MKKLSAKTLFSILVLGLSANLKAQTTSYSDVVGYSTITAAANGGSGVRYSLVSANLLNSSAWTGTINGSLQGAANSFTAGAFNAGSVFAKYYVEIVDGPAAGSQADIVSNTSDTLTVSGQASFQTAVGTGSSVKIRKHRTLVDLFGGASGTTGDTTVLIAKGTSLSAADNVILKEGGVDKSYYYSSNAIRPGWRDSSGNVSADRPIYPNQGLIIARKSNSAANIVVTGEVKQGVTFIDLPLGYNLITLPIPADSTLPSFFGGSSGTTGAADVKIVKGSSLSSADNILVAQSDGSYRTFYYSSNAIRPGWRDSAGTLSSTVSIPGSAAIFIKKLANGSISTTTSL